MVPLRISIAMACLLVPTIVSAQLEYNWRTGDRTQTGKLRAGKVISVLVLELNPVCYSTRVDVSLVEANEDLSELVAGLRRGTGEAAQSPADPVPPPAQIGQPADSLTAPSTEDEVRDLVAVHDAAREYVDVFRNKSRCAAPRGWSARDLIEHASIDIPEQIDVIEEADLQQLSTQLQQLQLTGTAGTRRDTLVARLAEMRSGRSDLIRDLRTILRELPTLRAGTEVMVQRHASTDVEQLLVQIQSTPTVGSSSPALEESIDARVARRFRLFTSVGVFAALSRQADYSRVNRQVVRDSIGEAGDTVRVFREDSTYSTYANVRRTFADVVSPTIQINLAIDDVVAEAVAPALTAGVAIRGTGDGIPAEPYAGLSISFKDRLVLSGGVHLSRQERLLITRPGERSRDVERRSVPTAITDGDAVGVHWTAGYYLSFSIRP